MKIFTAYQYLFYRIYRWQRRLYGIANMPYITALSVVSVLIWMNLVTLSAVFDLLSGFNILKWLENTIITSIVGFAIILTLNYSLFVKDKRYHRIAEKFERESEIKQRKRLFWCWFYVILSHIALFITVTAKSTKI